MHENFTDMKTLQMTIHVHDKLFLQYLHDTVSLLHGVTSQVYHLHPMADRIQIPVDIHVSDDA